MRTINLVERGFAQIRQARGISADRAAVLLRISPGHLRRLEGGRAPLPLPLAERMAGIYEVNLNELTRPPARAAGGQ